MTSHILTATSANGLTGSCTITVNDPARFPGDPGQGKIMWGMTHQGGVSAMPARALDLAAAIGRPGKLFPSSFHRYSDPSQATVAGARAAVADALVINSWQTASGHPVYAHLDIKEPLKGVGGATRDMTYADVGAGGMDAVFDALFQGLVTNGIPCMVGLHNEPQGDTANGSLVGMGAADFGAAGARMASRRDAAGAKGLVGLTAALGIGACSEAGGSKGSAVPWINACAPWCDVWDMHRYEQASDVSGKWNQPQELYGFFMDMLDAVDPNRAKFLTEWGIRTRTAVPGYSTAWMDTLLPYFMSRGGKCAHYFDSGADLNNQPIPWWLDYNGETSRLVKMAQQLILPTTY